MYDIMLVDDEITIRNGLRSILEKSELAFSHIYEASDGREAVALYNEFKPDIVITDISMPHVSGFEFIETVNRGKYKKPVFIILSVYDDFEFAKRAIQFGVKDYLLKPVGREDVIGLLERVIRELDVEAHEREARLVKDVRVQESIEIIKDKLFNLMLEPAGFDEQSLSRQLAGLGVKLDYSLFIAVVVDYRFEDMRLRDAFDELDRFSLKNIIDEVMSDITKDYYTFFDRANRFVIVLCGYNELLLVTYIKKAYQRLRACLSYYLKVSCYFGIGNGAGSISDFHRSYREAAEAANCKIFDEHAGLVSSRDITSDNTYSSDQSAFLTRITGEVELNNKNNIISAIEEEFGKFRGIGSAVELFNFYKKFQTYIYGYFVKKGVDFSLVFEPQEMRFKDLSYFWNMEQLKTYIKRTMLKLCDVVHSIKSLSPEKKVIHQIIQYINENYQKEINLNTISDCFKKSSSYLSVLFKKETGVNISDYIASVRMERAKELLTHTTMKVNDIAQRVGFVNVKHFCTVFRKIINVSPTEYRDKCI